MFMLGLPGGAYLYQGEELGLPDGIDIPDTSGRTPPSPAPAANGWAATAAASRCRGGPANSTPASARGGPVAAAAGELRGTGAGRSGRLAVVAP